MDYHTALHDERPETASPCSAARNDRVLAFAHDLTLGLPGAYESCDLLYADVPWSPGETRTFMERAEAGWDSDSWSQLLAVIVAAARRSRPTIITCGVRGVRLLPPADYNAPIYLMGPGRGPGVRARVLAFGTDEVPKAGSTVDLLFKLAQEYDCVGDPACGYGNTGRIFVRAGKRAVLSDVNPNCIGHIAKTMDTWGFGLE